MLSLTNQDMAPTDEQTLSLEEVTRLFLQQELYSRSDLEALGLSVPPLTIARDLSVSNGKRKSENEKEARKDKQFKNIVE